MPHYAIVNDQPIEITNETLPGSWAGLNRIIGKSTPDDRRFVMKVDPSMVKEKFKGKEAENLGRSPVLVYDIASPGWSRKFDSFIMNGISFLGGAAIAGVLYYTGVLRFFSH